MPNRYYQIFKQKIKELKEKTKPVEGLLLKYKETGDENIAKELEIKLKEIEEFIEEFKEEFTKRVYELLEEWYPKSRGLYEFLQNIKINEKGRVEIEELDVSHCGLSFLYLPSLFEKIKILNCSGNQLISLPKLPDSLECFACSYNQLISLPKLPDGLKELWCSNNYLQSLSKLPEGLKKLRCSDNKLTSLPELPDGLEELWCDYNPLSEETIKKIKSHPNYNPKTWTF